ncbi:MAG TPA: division/cell wall cluster transcriptional repressor MraZ [Stellaceae bacterium]|nr:division/cell wall cluster transcriptional repressor MraZ [Stellaceae bacterium]
MSCHPWGEGGSWGVPLFLSTFINKLDRKGRVSVPAPFRSALADQSYPGVVLFPAINSRALEGSGMDRMEELYARIAALPEFSDERDAISTIFADAQQLPFDSEGRITLPPEFCEHAGIVLEMGAAFVGNGKTFQIWEPGRFELHQQERRARARSVTLPLPAPAPK